MKAEKMQKIIEGDAGALEIRVHSQQEENNGVVIISHPHPLYGGTMNNKVVTTLEKSFVNQGYQTIAYNFRGVGESEGEYDNGIGEQEDLLSVVNWAKQNFPPTKLILAGFSFGSYVSLKVYETAEADCLCTVAPPVGLYDFSVIDNVEIPWMLIQGGKDEVVDSEGIIQWAMSRSVVPDVYWRSKASHFFHGELLWLRQIIQANY